jgi:hypothetical protein
MGILMGVLEFGLVLVGHRIAPARTTLAFNNVKWAYSR